MTISNLMKIAESSSNGWKTLWEKEKLLRAISPFPAMFSKDLYSRHVKTSACFGKGYLFPKQALVFTCLQYKSFKNTAEKREIAHNEQFLLFPQCFVPI